MTNVFHKVSRNILIITGALRLGDGCLTVFVLKLVNCGPRILHSHCRDGSGGTAQIMTVSNAVEHGYQHVNRLSGIQEILLR